MKKILGVFCAVMLMFTMTACGGEKSTKDQEKLVNDFFSYIEKGDLESIKNITTESGYKEVEILQKSLDAGMAEFEDTTKYGEITSKAANDYMDHMFLKLFKDVKIESAEIEDEETVVKVKGQQLDSTGFSAKVSGIDYNQMMTDFTNNADNKAKMQEIYSAQGQAEAVKWVVDQIAPDLFGQIKTMVDEAPYKDFNGGFKVIEKDGKWLINKIM